MHDKCDRYKTNKKDESKMEQDENKKNNKNP